jgi:hypothetical protein
MKPFARAAVAASVILATATAARTAGAAGLGGSPTSMRHQHDVAVGQAYTFLATQAEVLAFVEEGRLEPVTANADFALSDVSYPYARPEIRLFIERLGAQYHAVTGERLVVTSLVRPRAEQPSNASALSVHPAGMAVDIRVPADATRRHWLERTLLAFESAGVLDVTRELHPSHFHVAVFPAAYRAYAAQHAATTPSASTSASAAIATRVAPTSIVQVPNAAPAAHAARRAFALTVELLVASVLSVVSMMAVRARMVRREI